MMNLEGVPCLQHYSLLAEVRLHRRVSNVIKGPITFGVIEHDHWYQPVWINEDRAREGREKMVADDIIYGGGCVSRDSTYACS